MTRRQHVQYSLDGIDIFGDALSFHLAPPSGLLCRKTRVLIVTNQAVLQPIILARALWSPTKALKVRFGVPSQSCYDAWGLRHFGNAQKRW